VLNRDSDKLSCHDLPAKPLLVELWHIYSASQITGLLYDEFPSSGGSTQIISPEPSAGSKFWVAQRFALQGNPSVGRRPALCEEKVKQKAD